jgi:hypothetical protein
MPCTRHAVQIINPARPDHAYTSHRRALRMVTAGVAVWHVKGVSVRLVVVRANVAAPVAPWVECWRTAEAAVLQPYQPYQVGV